MALYAPRPPASNIRERSNQLTPCRALRPARTERRRGQLALLRFCRGLPGPGISEESLEAPVPNPGTAAHVVFSQGKLVQV